MQARATALVFIGMVSCGQPPSHTTAMTVCELSRDFTAYRNRVVAVRGVYFRGLRQQCPQTCATGAWPSFVDLVGSDAAGNAIWTELAKAERAAEEEAKHGRRIEVWVTVRGKLNASERRSPAGPCDPIVNSGFGHLGVFPAQIVAEAFSDVQLIPNPDSLYNYGRGYRGAPFCWGRRKSMATLKTLPLDAQSRSSSTQSSNCGFEDLRNIYASANANRVSDTGSLSAAEIAVESIPHMAETGGCRKSINLPHQAGLQLRDSNGIAHD